MESEILVSVYCLAYNHEKYIRSALEGFVTQKTDFAYEVFVHDDASTDGTADIIREYAEKYPEIIKPIYQTDNQYSKGVKITKTFILPIAKGKYIASCEGDDYWCDENKLQKQIDFLEAHPDYSACVHNSIKINCLTGRRSLISKKKTDCDLRLDEICTLWNYLFQISSVVYRREYFDLPSDFIARGFGDYSRYIYLALKGRIYYFKDVMSTYRFCSQGSWSMRTHLSDDREKTMLAHYTSFSQLLNQIDKYFDDSQKGAIIAARRFNEFRILRLNKEYKSIIDCYHDVLVSRPFKERAEIRLAKALPFGEKLYRKLMYILKGKRR